MDIHVVSGTGEGNTELSAFDDALRDSGVYNYNLIYLSSMIPPQTDVKVVGTLENYPGDPGDKLYVVAAQERSSQKGEAVAAGIGWYQFDGTRHGVFVEHHAKADTSQAGEKEVARLIEASIRDLCAFRDVPFVAEKMEMALSSSVVGEKPACAIVLAVFEAEGWLARR